MIKFILPTIIIFLIVLYWEKINEIIFKKFNVKMKYISVFIILLLLIVISILLYF